MQRLGFCALSLSLLAGLAACAVPPPLIENTSVLEDTSDTVGPYMVHAVITDASPGHDIVELRYRVDDQARYIPLAMQPDTDGERFHAGIPGQPAGSIIAYYVAVVRDGERIVSDPVGAAARPYSFAILAQDPSGGQ